MSDLYLYDSSFDAWSEQVIAKGMFRISEKPVPIRDWNGLAAVIMTQARIGHLVLSFHGASGIINVGNEGIWLGEPAVKKLFDKPGRRPPKIERITVLGCDVGEGPFQMLEFGKIFGAKAVSAYTWGILKGIMTLKFPKGIEESKIKETLDSFKEYAVGDLPAPNVLVKTQTAFRNYDLKIVVCYGTADDSKATKVPIPFGEQKTHKPLTVANDNARKITALDAEAEEEKYKSTPVTSFEFVTVTL